MNEPHPVQGGILDAQWAETLQQIQDKPWFYGYLPMMRRLSAYYRQQPSIGCAERPQQESFRIGQQPSLIFAPREIASVTVHENGQLHIALFSLGLWGANGPLPLHYTEIARNRKESSKDTTLVDFADLFHHRYLTQFYCAWRSAQSAGGGLDREEEETFSFYVASLTGQNPRESGHGALPAHARLAAGAHLVREARNPDGLSATLSHFFGVPFTLHEYQLHWIAIAAEERTQLGRPGPAALMGEGALLGEKIPDRQHKFRLAIGPLDLKEYLRFLPMGGDLPSLIEWVRAFVGYEYVWDVALQLNPRSASPARIGGEQRLGWSTWLGQSGDDQPVTGMVFEPENYAAKRNI